MNFANKNYLQISVGVSIAIHLVILLVLGGFLIHQPEYSVLQGVGSTEVDLVASLPSTEKVAEAKATVPTAVPSKTSVAQTQPLKKSRSKAEKSHRVRATGKQVAARGPGARVSAKPDYLRNPPPTYPEDARQAHQEGVVMLRVVVSPNGTVMSVAISRSSGFESLDNAALEAVQNWKFKPGSIAGVPTKSVVAVPVRFQLQ